MESDVCRSIARIAFVDAFREHDCHSGMTILKSDDGKINIVATQDYKVGKLILVALTTTFDAFKVKDQGNKASLEPFHVDVFGKSMQLIATKPTMDFQNADARSKNAKATFLVYF